MVLRALALVLAVIFGVLGAAYAAASNAGASNAADPNPPTLHSSRGAWPIRRQWTPAEVLHYAQWVEHIYEMKTKGSIEQRIAKIQRIITDPEMNLLENPSFLGQGGNPQLPVSVLRTIHASLDCAKLTCFIPAYYAYRRALPWMISYVAPGEGDVRTSEYNVVSGTMSTLDAGSASDFFIQASIGYSSGNYRVNLTGRNAELSDTLPVAIDPRYLLPGCMNYTDGHSLVLAKVSDYGEIHFLNCSTTETRDIFTYNGMNTVAGITPRGYDETDEWNGCYQGLRVLRYPIALVNSAGGVVGIRRRTNEEMKEFGFSTEQYEIIRELISNQFIVEGKLKPQSFHDLIRLRMKKVDHIKPLEFLEAYADELLEVYQIREQFVQDAWRDVLKNGPIVYPEELLDENIFQAKGRWETWSSPSSDVDRRNKYFYLADWLDYAIRCYEMMPEYVKFDGLEKYNIQSQAGLARALIDEKRRIFRAHSMTYRKSSGETIPLSLIDIEERLYDLSFDPNHPPELRWGAPAGTAERASAPERYTPVPTGERIPMQEAYLWQSYYRCLGLRETGMSALRGMFTEGFPVRKKLDQQLTKWFLFDQPIAVTASAIPPETAPPPKTTSTRVHVLVPRS